MLRKETENNVNLIMDTYSDAFLYFRFKLMIEDMDRQAQNGDINAAALVKIVSDFARLIQVANKNYN